MSIETCLRNTTTFDFSYSHNMDGLIRKWKSVIDLMKKDTDFTKKYYPDFPNMSNEKYVALCGEYQAEYAERNIRDGGSAEFYYMLTGLAARVAMIYSATDRLKGIVKDSNEEIEHVHATDFVEEIANIQKARESQLLNKYELCLKLDYTSLQDSARQHKKPNMVIDILLDGLINENFNNISGPFIFRDEPLFIVKGPGLLKLHENVEIYVQRPIILY